MPLLRGASARHPSPGTGEPSLADPGSFEQSFEPLTQ